MSTFLTNACTCALKSYTIELDPGSAYASRAASLVLFPLLSMSMGVESVVPAPGRMPSACNLVRTVVEFSVVKPERASLYL